MNREIVQPSGAGIYPLQGDVTSTAGSSTVRVTGIQGVKVQALLPPFGTRLTYNQNTNEWEPLNDAVMYINLLPVSDDYIILVNFNSIQVFTISVNGASTQTIIEPSTGPVNVNGTPVV